jgi:hypothetical protein
MSPRRISILMCDTVEVTLRQQKAPGDVGTQRVLPGGRPSEYERGRDLMDVMLKRAGWDQNDITKATQEPDTKQSEF